MPASTGQLAEIEADPLLWQLALFEKYLTSDGQVVEDAPHHRRMWTWLWAIEPGSRPRPFVGIWPRGGAKSTKAELGAVALGARKKRKYVWYVSETQPQADDHIATIGSMLESEEIATYYPDLASRRVGKYGDSKGWRRNRLSTAGDFTVDAVGLDTAARGVKFEEARPDLIVFDDIDGRHDSQDTTAKKIATITDTLIPAGSADRALLFIQNLVHPTSIFARLAEGTAGFLTQRILSGPEPAVTDLTYAEDPEEHRIVITGGTPTWAGQDIAACQAAIDEQGISSFLQESQHEVKAPPGGMFDHLDLAALRIAWDDVPALDRVVCWVDPAVTKTDQSDAHAIQVDGIAGDTIYRLWSWEQRATPRKAIKKAIQKAAEYGARYVGIETDQGGDTWRSVFREAKQDALDAAQTEEERVRIRRLLFNEAKAGQGGEPKTHRAGIMLTDYEKPGQRIRHVIGTHLTLENALDRFPRTRPLDLVDAGYWAWDDLRNGPEIAGYNPDDHEDQTDAEDPYAARRSSTWAD